MTAIAGVISSAINIDENATEYVVYVAVPGMQRGDFSITIGQGVLTITAVKSKDSLHCFGALQKKEEKSIQWTETIELPGDADTVMTAANYRNGELQIHIPKGEKEENNESTEIFVY